jgi:branched-chain amino acid transport system permease protein
VTRALLPWLILAAVLALAPFVFSSDFALTTMSLICINAIFALSFNILLGQTGLLSFGHAVYFGLGGYVTIHLLNATRGILPLPLFPFIGGLGGLFFGVLFGLVASRRGGIVFSMISLGLGELVSSSSFILRTFFGGEEGITANRTKAAAFFGLKFGSQIQVYYLTAAWCLIAMIAIRALTATPLGKIWNAARENPERVEFIGYRPETLRFYAFVFAAGFAGVAGGLSVVNFEIMNAQQLGAQQSGLVLLMAYVGGVGHFFGPALGAAVITYMQARLSDLTDVWQLYFGLLFIGVVMLAPGGLAGWIAMHIEAARRGELGRLAPSYAAVAPAIVLVCVGATLTIELAHLLFARSPGDPAVLSLGSLNLDATTIAPWLATFALLIVGLAGLSWAWPRVRMAWGAAAPAAPGEKTAAESVAKAPAA